MSKKQNENSFGKIADNFIGNSCCQNISFKIVATYIEESKQNLKQFMLNTRNAFRLFKHPWVCSFAVSTICTTA